MPPGVIERMGCVADELNDQWELEELDIKSPEVSAEYRHETGGYVFWSSDGREHTVQSWYPDGGMDGWLDGRESLDGATQAFQTAIHMVESDADMPSPEAAQEPSA